MKSPGFGLRPSTADDFPFVFALNKSNCQADAGPGWDEDAERTALRERFRPGRDWIVTKHNERIGILCLDRRSDEIVLRHIELLPAHQNHGIGGALLRGVLEFAAAAKLPVRLRVLRDSAARRLYERLGFEVTGEEGDQVAMMVTPGPDTVPAA